MQCMFLAVAGLYLALMGHAAADVLEVGQGKPYRLLSAAVQAAQSGDHIRIAPGRYADCAAIVQDDLVIEGTGPASEVVVDGVACEGKAALVTKGARITVRDLTLTHILVPSGNGAGIRPEGADLLVERVRFIANENGILAAPNPASTIIVRDSEFVRNGACNPLCEHGIYVNALTLLRVEHSRFFETMIGHHIKSRAARTEVIDCDLADGTNGRSSYQINVPNGGALVVRGNRIEKGPGTDNPRTVISIGEEDVTQKPGEVTIEDNKVTLVGLAGTVFVRNLGTVPAMLSGNRLIGDLVPLVGPGTVR